MTESLEMEYETIFAVIDSWEHLRRIDNYELVAGTILFTKYVEMKINIVLVGQNIISPHLYILFPSAGCLENALRPKSYLDFPLIWIRIAKRSKAVNASKSTPGI